MLFVVIFFRLSVLIVDVVVGGGAALFGVRVRIQV